VHAVSVPGTQHVVVTVSVLTSTRATFTRSPRRVSSFCRTEMHNLSGYEEAVAEGEKHPKLLRDTLCARNKIRTARLWGLRLRSRFMHDGNSVQLDDAIRRHSGESSKITERFLKLKALDQKALLTFLQSL
jgi:CxxC motif-containing protein (DUF1111 family)